MGALHQGPCVPTRLCRLFCAMSRLSLPESAARPSCPRFRSALLLLACPALVALAGCPSAAISVKIKPAQLLFRP
ncbi:UNVERIFIED_ORG: hypothetical protein J2811_003421 [Burkholderia cepacia]|jgi:hypothetical protein|uniref:Uncharacterized protein n=1 Tax=Paraburkholderia phytofirmans (strain DSM 17436 / LMG 22146 / PsJN) TaxID=398527 RepID=B2T1J5_PARPJ|nr:hypothetical protein Bphyt_0299 [Paraburkholderia phytofirmans PsJN]MDP9545999.1 hypothetical protein [Burkholderia cepacia]PRZ55725.1 hypothetical protein BX589_103313 [Paraburkholderia fungorum]PZX02492.1 hypothetical protein DFS13_10637 [Burkholderia sp. 28_3]RAS54684.1 hypothetical protein DFS07_10537 [Burkholderia cenocepacia]